MARSAATLTNPDREHPLGTFALDAELLPLGFDDAIPTSCWYGSDARFVLVVLIGIAEHVLEDVLREELGHRSSQHRLPGTRVTDHQHVTPLLGGLAG